MDRYSEAPPPHDPAVWKAILPSDAPPPAVAPFDTTQAKAHQQAWADYLDLPVEREIELPAGEKLALWTWSTGKRTSEP